MVGFKCHSVNYDTFNAELTLFKMSLLWQLDINQEIITRPTCSTLLEGKGNINDTVVKAFGSVITLNAIFITSTMCSTLLEDNPCNSYNGVMTT